MSVTSPAATTHPRLSRDTIVDAYTRLADVMGPEAVSLRQLGAELGFDATAVYRHFRDKAELLEAVADRLLQQLADRTSRRATGVATSGRSPSRRGPCTSAIPASRGSSRPRPSRCRAIAGSRSRPSGRCAAPACRIARSRRRTRRSPRTSPAPRAWTPSSRPHVGEDWRRTFASLDAGEFPNVAAIAPHLYRSDPDGFLFGLELLLDAIDARARLARGPRA